MSLARTAWLIATGSSYLNHRQDQSVLSVLFALRNRTCPDTEGREFAFLNHDANGRPAVDYAITVHHDAPGEGAAFDSLDRARS